MITLHSRIYSIYPLLLDWLFPRSLNSLYLSQRLSQSDIWIAVPYRVIDPSLHTWNHSPSESFVSLYWDAGKDSLQLRNCLNYWVDDCINFCGFIVHSLGSLWYRLLRDSKWKLQKSYHKKKLKLCQKGFTTLVVCWDCVLGNRRQHTVIFYGIT